MLYEKKSGSPTDLKTAQQSGLLKSGTRTVLAPKSRIGMTEGIFRLDEKRQHLLVAPISIAHITPTIEVGRDTTHIKHGIYA